MADDEIPSLFEKLASGDEEAAQVLWNQYFRELTKLARRHLDGLPLRAADEEDVALSAIRSFQRGMAAGYYPCLKDREDLWKLLITITSHKAADYTRRERSQKRGEGRVRGESVFRLPGNGDSERGFEQIIGASPSPEFALMMVETCRDLLERLGDATLRSIALCKLEGESNQKIAETLGCTVRTVERKVARIRERWRRTRNIR